MTNNLLDKSLLYSSEAQSEMQKFSEKLGNDYFEAWDFGKMVGPLCGSNKLPNPHYLGKMKYSAVVKGPEDLWMVRMKEMVNVGSGLIQQKVLADVLHGAEHNKAWKDWTRIVPMDDPKDSIPTISEDDFIFAEGNQAAKPRYMGGKFGSVSFDCSEDKGLHKMVLGIKKTWISDNKWNSIQEATTVAGGAAYKHVAADLAAKLAAAALGTEAFATDLYNTAVKAISTVRKAGFNVDAMLINPDQEAVFMAMDKFISIEMLGRVGRLAQEGVIGNFYGTIPVYSTSVCGANPIVYSTAKGAPIGLRQDLAIEDYDDPIAGLEGAVLTMRFDPETAFSSAIRLLATS